MSSDETKRRVTYIYEPSIGAYNYGDDHFMKPSRIFQTDEIVRSYGLHKHMNVIQPFRATADQIMAFHSKDYVKFLESVSPNLVADLKNKAKIKKFQFPSGDCPYFEGVYEFSQLSAGGSIAAALALINGSADIAINWAGGLHHAMMTHASGFCYVNDIVLGILELLKVHARVLYVDIDIHHGDGVEEAFLTTNRVMTVSFHKYAKGFFPETGNFNEIGADDGRGYSLNVPLDDGLDDESFARLFEPVIQKVMDVYQPEAVVLQCGADSLFGDVLGTFNLTIKGHASCLKFLRKFNIPMMVLGGGGYSVDNVAKCWAYETSVAVGREINSDLDLAPRKDNEVFVNKNTESDLEELRNLLIQRVSELAIAPNMDLGQVAPHTKVREEAEDPMEEGRSRISMMSATDDEE